MITEHDVQQQVQRMHNLGIPESEIQHEIGLRIAAERTQAAQAARAAAEAANPPPPRELLMPYSDRQERALDAQMARGTHYQAEERRIIAAIEALDRQILPLQQQRAALADALAKVRFQG